MASLKNILNPERRRSVKLLVSPPEDNHTAWDSTTQVSPPDSPSDDDQEDYNPLEHIPHPDCPDSLACLPDTDGRPQHTLPVILRCAILGSPRKRLTIREIYAAMEEKYAYYRTAGATWKQSVRHHLSLNRLFERQPRPATDPGFGSYWTVNLAAPPGTKRPRKRGRPNKEAQPRAKKNDVIMVQAEDMVGRAAGKGSSKRVSPTAPVLRHPEQSMQPPIEAAAPLDDEDDTTDMLMYEDEAVDELDSQTSEEECESEEKMLLHPFERRHSLSGVLTPYDQTGGYHMSPASPTSHLSPRRPPSPPHHSISPRQRPAVAGSSSEDIIERLQMEMANLRRQSAEAITLSMRLSDQLANAEAEKSKAQSTLKVTEIKLRDEVTRRRQAEREADNAIRLRHAAEEALKSAQFHTDMQPRVSR